MTNAELLTLNAVFGQKMKLPALDKDRFYKLLSVKAALSEKAEQIEKRAEMFRKETMPAGVDEYAVKLSDPAAREWWNSYMAMRSRLVAEEAEGTQPERVIPRDLFPDMAEGLTAAEAELVMQHLVETE